MIVDAAELERAICADPDDDVPRRALADRLRERGDPRGRFIELQLRVADARRSEDVSAARWGAWWLEAEELRRRHGAAWMPPLPAFATDPQFARGFVEQVTAPAAALVERSAELVAAAPIRRLHVADAGPIAGRFFASPALARMIALDFTGDRLGDAGAIALAASPHLARVVWLDLSNNRIGAAGLDALLASPHLGALRYCRFAWNLVDSPEEGHGVEGGVVSTEAGEATLAAEARYGPRPWLRAPSLHPHAYPPEPDDLLGPP
jgi:uncharacterized protein (TIGR02996 family)